MPKKIPLNKTSFLKSKLDKSKNAEIQNVTTEDANNRINTEMNEFLRSNTATKIATADIPKKVKDKNNEVLKLIQLCIEFDFEKETEPAKETKDPKEVKDPKDTKDLNSLSTYNENYMKHVKKLSQTIQEMNINDALMDERVVDGCLRVLKKNIKRNAITYHSNSLIITF